MLPIAESFWDTFFRDPNVAGPVSIMAMIVLIVVIPVIARCWQQVAKTRAEASLKQSMVERGMSVEEIERVMRAGPPDKK